MTESNHYGGEVFSLSAVDVRCPVCGAVNKSLDLEETDGWMECENCGNVSRHPAYTVASCESSYRKDEVQILIPLSKRS